MGGRSSHRRDIKPEQARLVTARFVLRQLLFFFFLAEVPHYGIPICFLVSIGNHSEQQDFLYQYFSFCFGDTFHLMSPVSLKYTRAMRVAEPTPYGNRENDAGCSFSLRPSLVCVPSPLRFSLYVCHSASDDTVKDYPRQISFLTVP